MANEVLIKCVDCKSFPDSCGYWKSKHKKHTCKGFVSAEDMTLDSTLYALRRMDIRWVRCNSQVINKAIQFLSELGLGSVRPSVYLHARKMESRLREKDEEKGEDGWRDGKLYYYISNVANCVNRIVVTVATPMMGVHIEERKIGDIKVKDIHLALKKCYDGSNFLMMLADNLRDELVKRGIKGNGK